VNYGVWEFLTPARAFLQTIPHHPPYPLTASTHAQRLMEQVEKGENSEKESPPLQIDPKWYVRDAILLISSTTKLP